LTEPRDALTAECRKIPPVVSGGKSRIGGGSRPESVMAKEEGVKRQGDEGRRSKKHAWRKTNVVVGSTIGRIPKCKRATQRNLAVPEKGVLGEGGRKGYLM